jgi:hypothetical protein
MASRHNPVNGCNSSNYGLPPAGVVGALLAFQGNDVLNDRLRVEHRPESRSRIPAIALFEPARGALVCRVEHVACLARVDHGQGRRLVVPLLNALLELRTRADGEHELTRRVRAEYAEMPGLCLTLPQAQRLWVVDRQTCEAVFTALIAHGFLRMTTNGRFVRC